MKLTYKIIAVAFVLCLAAMAQSPADKVYLTKYSPVADVDVLSLDTTKPILSGWIKTSNVGAILAGLSMECSIWTNTSTQVVSNTGKSWSTARAAVEVDVMVDGTRAIPGKVVYCDRLQAVALTLDTVCTLTGSIATLGGCVVTDTLVLDLFQKTKNANHFNFYLPNSAVSSSAAMHKVEVYVKGAVDCLDSKGSTTCSSSTYGSLAGSTKALIGKATLVVENINNSNLN